jgi:DNA adenine methylase
VIGGLRRDGEYKMDARLKKPVIAARIELIALHASQISVYNEDAGSLLERSKTFLPSKSLVYLDPPYYVKGQGLYRNYYAHEDHERIAKLLKSPTFRRKWVVSYDNVPEIQLMYRLTKALTYGLHYTAQVRYIGSEIMFFSDGLRLPATDLPDVAAVA